jgi:hypothetical protein
MLGRRIALVVFVCSSLFSSFSSLHAEPTSPEILAKIHYRTGRAHLERGEFAEAILEFETGYKLKPLPLFIYNIAQVERVAGETQKAIADYERYLKAEPHAPERAEVEGWIALLRQRLQEAPPPASAAPPATAAEPAPAPGEAANPTATSPSPAGATPAPSGEAANPATNPPPAGTTAAPSAATATPAAAEASPPSLRVPLTAPGAAVSAPGAAGLTLRHQPDTRSRRKLWITVGTVGGVLVVGAVVTAIAVTVSGGGGVPSGYHNWGALDYHH